MKNLNAVWTFAPGAMRKQAGPSAWTAHSTLDAKGGSLTLYVEFPSSEMPFSWDEFPQVWAPVLMRKVAMMATNLTAIYKEAGAIGVTVTPKELELGKAFTIQGISLQGTIKVTAHSPANTEIQKELVEKLKALEFKLK